MDNIKPKQNFFNTKDNMKKLVIFLIVVIITLLLISSAKVPEHKDDGYKIKVVSDTINGKGITEKIMFVSPDGEIIKRMNNYKRNEEIQVSEENGKYNVNSKRIEAISENKVTILMYKSNYQLNYNPKESKGYGANKYTNEVKIINARGEEKSLTTVEAYNHKLLGYSFFETDISKDGSTVYIYYMDSTKIYHIEIYDTTGNKLTATSYPKVFELEKQISPDGSIFGATRYSKEGKLLYFLNTETGEVKICKAEGEIDGELWMIGGSPLNNKIIGLFGYHPVKGRLSLKLSFDDLPKDPTILLFLQEQEEYQ